MELPNCFRTTRSVSLRLLYNSVHVQAGNFVFLRSNARSVSVGEIYSPTEPSLQASTKQALDPKTAGVNIQTSNLSPTNEGTTLCTSTTAKQLRFDTPALAFSTANDALNEVLRRE